MATKSKLTNESSPPQEKKGGTKLKQAVTQTPAPAKAVKASKTASIEKDLPKTVPPKSKEKITPEKTDKSAVKAAPKEKTIVAPLAQPVTPVASQDQKWLEIRAILEKLKDDTIREIRKSVKIGTEAVAAIEPGGDIYDQASSERDRELGLLLGDREREKIHSIDEALLRIDDGEYGICEECDEDIPLGRLKAMPFTRHCVKCKSDLEKLQAQTKRVEEERAYREIPLGAEDEES